MEDPDTMESSASDARPLPAATITTSQHTLAHAPTERPAWHRDHLIGLALTAIRQGDIDGALRLINGTEPGLLSIGDVFSLYQLELETQNSDLQETQARTEATLNWFSHLFRHLPVAAVLLNPTGLIMDANVKANSLLELAQDGKRSPPPLRRYLVNLDAEARLGALLKRATSEQIEILNDVPVRAASGALHWADLRLVAMPPQEHADRAPLILCIINDRTDQVEAQRAREAAAQAEMQRDMAQSAADMRARMLARVSHEFRTPLNAVIGFSDLLLNQPQHLATESSRKFVQAIRDAGANLLVLVDEVLQINRTFSSPADLAPQEVDLLDIAQNVSALMAPLAAMRDVSMFIDTLPGHSTKASGHARRVREVLINLLSNAIKYNRSPGWVRVTLGEENDRIWLSVADSGVGLTPEQMAHLFEPFNRLGAENAQSEGHGLGLCVARSLVEAMGGDLSVESTPGVGSCFKLSLSRWPARTS